VGQSAGKKPLGNLSIVGRIKLKLPIKVGLEGLDRTDLAEDRASWRTL